MARKQGQPSTPEERLKFLRLVDSGASPPEAAGQLGRGRSWAFDQLARRRDEVQYGPAPVVDRQSDDRPMLLLTPAMHKAHAELGTVEHDAETLIVARNQVLVAFEQLFGRLRVTMPHSRPRTSGLWCPMTAFATWCWGTPT